MKRLVFVAGMLILAFAVGTPAFAQLWGDFEVVDDLFETEVAFFLPPDTPTNPSPFSPPSVLQQANTYPASGAPNAPVTAGTYKNYLSNNGFAVNTFGLEIILQGNSSVTFASMVISIDGNPAATSSGMLTATNSGTSDARFYLLPQLNLCTYNSDDPVLISYNTTTGYTNVKSINMGATPEPISMAFLGTGLLGTILYRAKRKRKG